MVKSVGAWRLAATVWPTSTVREMTVPSTGARMDVYSRSTCDCCSAACFWRTAALGPLTWASVTLSWGLGCLDRGGQRLLLGPARLETRRRLVVHGLGSVEVAARDQLLAEQVLLAVEIARRASRRAELDLAVWARALARAARALLDLGAGALDLGALIEHGGLRCLELRPHLGQLGLEGRGVDARDELPALHLGVEVGEQLPDLARDLGAHLDRDHRIEVAGGGDGRGDRAAGDGGGPEARRAPPLWV